MDRANSTAREDGVRSMEQSRQRARKPGRKRARRPNHSRALTVLLPLAALLAAGCGSGSSSGTSSGHSVSGSVSGEVKSGVTVALTLPGATSAGATATTDASGAYAFRGLGDATYVATASLPGYVFAPHAGRQVTVAGADVSGQDFLASAAHHAIRGTVTGVVTAGVQITLSGASSATTTSAADGSYGFPSVEDGTYTLSPSLTGTGFTPGARTVTLSGADALGQDFATSVASLLNTISGATSGAVKAGVAIALQSGAGATLSTAITDASGAYAFASLGDGQYRLTPTLTGYTFTPRSLAVTLNGADAPSQDFAAAASTGATQVGELATGVHLPYGIAIGNDLNAWITDPLNGMVSRVLLQDSSLGARGDVKDVLLAPATAQPTGIALRFFGLRCFTETVENRVGCVNFDGSQVFTVAIPTPASGALDIVNGPGVDQHNPDMWFTERDAGKVGRLRITEGPTSSSGTIVAEYALPAGCKPTALAWAVDGNIWWAAVGCNRIGSIDRTSGAVHVVDVEVGQPVGLAINLGETAVWFVDAASDRLGRLTATGGLTWFSPPAGSRLTGVTLGPDEALYVTELAGNAIARFPLARFDPNANPNTGRLTEELALPIAGAQPFLITSGTDGNVWFTERGQQKIGAVFMPTHCIFGKVTLTDLVTPVVPAVTVTLAPASGIQPTTTSTAADGNYSFCGLPPGSYTVTPSLASRTFRPPSLAVTMSLSNLIDRSFVTP